MPTTTSTRSSGAAKSFFLAGLVAGTLDILGAITVYVVIMKRLTTVRLLQGIARGALGKSAFTGGTATALAGLGFHFLIAFTWAGFYVLIFPYIPFLRKQKIIGGLLYGIFVWCVMNLVVLPLLGVAPIPTKWDGIARGALILMFCIGLPISLIVNKNYILKNRQ
ncbi:MAG TPA: hypothetical protein VGG71_04210 [Chitinophagaceae bacterium]